VKTIVITCLFISLVVANDAPLERWEFYLRNDFKQMQATFTAGHLMYTGIGLAALYGLSWYDQDVTEYVQDRYQGSFKTYLDITNELGNAWYIIPGSALVTGISLLTSDRKFQDAAFTSLQSLLIAGGINGIIKFTVGRSRPEAGQGPHHFKPFSGNVSFPSGHATIAFALLTPWILYYPSPFTYALFTLPAGTALARIAKDKHWATDVLTGSFIGFSVAYLLHKWHVTAYQDNYGNNTRINLGIAL
jgi:membrane-associated phospholipid phosphatase